MSLNAKCPKCGSEKTQLTKVKKHGCLYLILFGWIYILWRLFKAIIGIVMFFLYDWWVAIIQKIRGRGHIWVIRKCFSGKKRYYYCHDCGNNFRT